MKTSPLYSFAECTALLTDCRLDELVALSALLSEEWKGYTIREQTFLLEALVKRKKELMRTNDRQWLYFRKSGA
jgi:hypothetical protein